MTSAGLAAPAVVYLLADHLDASLAAGEDLLKSTLRWNTGDARFDTLNEQRREERQAIEAARTLEMVLVARVLKARESAQELAKLESQFKVVARLFAGGTQVVADAATELADATSIAFDAGSGITGCAGASTARVLPSGKVTWYWQPSQRAAGVCGSAPA